MPTAFWMIFTGSYFPAKQKNSDCCIFFSEEVIQLEYLVVKKKKVQPFAQDIADCNDHCVVFTYQIKSVY